MGMIEIFVYIFGKIGYNIDLINKIIAISSYMVNNANG